MNQQRRVTLDTRAGELDSYGITGVFKDEAEVPIPAASFTTLTLTLFNDSDGAIINSVNGTSILNTGRGTVAADGSLVCTLLPADNPIIGNETEEKHVAFFQWTYAAGTKAGAIEVEFYVRNYVKKP